MKKRLINSFILAAAFVTATSFKAYAAVDAYLLKDSSNVYQYNVEELKDSFMNSKIGIEDGLYKEFKNILSNGEFYQIYDSEKKYISYNEVKNVFLEKKAKEENFNLEEEIKKSKEAEAPAQVENVKIENIKVIRELFILKNDFVLDGSKILKEKYKSIHIKGNNVTVSNLDISGDLVINPGNLGKVKIDNVKCNLVNVLSGDKKGLVFNRVESKEVKINANLEIEIQYEDKTPPVIGGGGAGEAKPTTPVISAEEKQKMLNKAYAQLNQVHLIITNTKEKEVVAKMTEGISKAISDANYNYSSDMAQAKSLYNALSASEKSDLQSKLMSYVDLINIYKLMEVYGISL